MIKGKVKDAIWFIEGIMVLWILVGLMTKNYYATIPAWIILFANFLLLSVGSRVDKRFLIYPYATFIAYYGITFYLWQYYYHAFYGKVPDILWLGFHPSVTILWLFWGWIGPVFIVFLPYMLWFDRYVVDEKSWESFVAEAQQFRRDETTMK